ncbi:hypothetical protein AMS68_007470 [Peltaster fructicola]|uniref:DHHA2 domain-containing protein n=1 Tax=Peltaster fructicola TaxID=286661 RepID=A0A6H0Y4N0_9PEZI|nr:hypothetical protein AMS68_007470 [Peltaster fructicola]
MRSSVRTYLVRAKKHLYTTKKSGSITKFVVGNESADLDSIACAIVYGYIQTSSSRSHSAQDIVIPVTNIPAADLSLRPELTALLTHADVKPEHLITLDDIKAAGLDSEQTAWTLVDHNVLTGLLAKSFASRIGGVIDHHEDEDRIPKDAVPRLIEKSGSCCSLLANYSRPTWDEINSRASGIGAAIAQDDGRLLDDAAYASTWTAHVAKLAIGPILIDTINMTDEHKVTDTDRKALRYLEALVNIAPRVGKDYDRDSFFKELDAAKSDVAGLSVRDLLRKDYKEWDEDDIKLGTGVIVKPLSFAKSRSDDWEKDISSFMEERGVNVMAVTTAFNDEQGVFHRELALFTTSDDKAVQTAKAFVATATKELQLEDQELGLTSGQFGYCHGWTQRNLAASRKQSAPLLRKAMQHRNTAKV